MKRDDATDAENDWYERERAAFIAWWESEGQKKFGETPTIAAGAGWLARAEAASTASEKVPPIDLSIATALGSTPSATREKNAAGEAGASILGSERAEPVGDEARLTPAATPSATLKPDDIAVPRRFLTDFLKALNFHGGHGTPSFDRVQAECLAQEAEHLLQPRYVGESK